MSLDLVSRVTSVFRAYAAGDAFGVAHEFLEIPITPVENILLEKQGWPYGGVSDDTMLTLLTVLTLSQDSPEQASQKFLSELRAALPHLRGLGPTTKAALGLEVNAHETHLVGMTNGAMMRCALSGMAFSAGENLERDEWIRALASTTHTFESAVTCAQLAAALFSDAIENGDKNSIETLVGTRIPQWVKREKGVSLDPIETLSAVIYVVGNCTSAAQAYVRACELGGDTDTVAALSGALITARKGAAADFENIEWLADIVWEEIPTMGAAVETLCARRNK
jgi:ADP-ribosylglycohydrolase